MSSYCTWVWKVSENFSSHFPERIVLVSIRVDPFNHLIIAGVAFEGIYLKYFLPEKTLITVPRPTKDNHLFKSILWMEYVMSGSKHFIQHAGN